MLPVDYLRNAVLAKCVATLRDVRVIERLEADDALRKLTDDLLNGDLDLLVEP